MTIAFALAFTWMLASPPRADHGVEHRLEQPSAGRVVEQLERELIEAIRSLDLSTYDRIVADDYIVVALDGGEQTKADIVASYRTGARRYPGLAIEDVRVHVFGDTAVLAATTTGSRLEGEKEVPNEVRYVRVYARREGHWRAVAQMAAPVR